VWLCAGTLVTAACRACRCGAAREALTCLVLGKLRLRSVLLLLRCCCILQAAADAARCSADYSLWPVEGAASSEGAARGSRAAKKGRYVIRCGSEQAWHTLAAPLLSGRRAQHSQEQQRQSPARRQAALGCGDFCASHKRQHRSHPPLPLTHIHPLESPANRKPLPLFTTNQATSTLRAAAMGAVASCLNSIVSGEQRQRGSSSSA
jgi:hypothetical protein